MNLLRRYFQRSIIFNTWFIGLLLVFSFLFCQPREEVFDVSIIGTAGTFRGALFYPFIEVGLPVGEGVGCLVGIHAERFA